MLKVFEAFSGYGSQRIAMKNLKIDHEIVVFQRLMEMPYFPIQQYIII